MPCLRVCGRGRGRQCEEREREEREEEEDAPVDRVPALLARVRERAHGRIARCQVAELAGPAAEPAVRVLAPAERVDDAAACVAVELAVEEGEGVDGPVEEPGARGVEAGKVLGEGLGEELCEVARVGVAVEGGRGGRGEVVGEEVRDGLLGVVLETERVGRGDAV